MRAQRTPRPVVLAALVAVVVACGGDGRLAELEAENEALQRQVADLSASTTDAPAPAETTAATVAPATTLPAQSTSLPTTAVTSPASEAAVISVTDGDTLRALVDGANEPVRLIGINAPEDGECLAARATTRLAELLAAGPLRLERDVSNRDQFDRLLRYVFAGSVLVNEAMVREGLALANRYEPDVARQETLERAQAEAEAQGVGIWDPAACGAAAGGSIEIGHIRYDADGNDNFNLNDEWVELVNAGTQPLDLTGWVVKDESATHRYAFPAGFVLAAEAPVRLHTGCGDDTAAALYWCKTNSAVWNNSGDTVFVLDPNGNVVVSESY